MTARVRGPAGASGYVVDQYETGAESWALIRRTDGQLVVRIGASTGGGGGDPGGGGAGGFAVGSSSVGSDATVGGSGAAPALLVVDGATGFAVGASSVGSTATVGGVTTTGGGGGATSGGDTLVPFPPIDDEWPQWLAATVDTAAHTVTSWTSPDGVHWLQHAKVTSPGVAAPATPTAPMRIGGDGGSRFNGQVQAAGMYAVDSPNGSGQVRPPVPPATVWDFPAEHGAPVLLGHSEPNRVYSYVIPAPRPAVPAATSTVYDYPAAGGLPAVTGSPNPTRTYTTTGYVNSSAVVTFTNQYRDGYSAPITLPAGTWRVHWDLTPSIWPVAKPNRDVWIGWHLLPHYPPSTGYADSGGPLKLTGTGWATGLATDPHMDGRLTCFIRTGTPPVTVTQAGTPVTTTVPWNGKAGTAGDPGTDPVTVYVTQQGVPRMAAWNGIAGAPGDPGNPPAPMWLFDAGDVPAYANVYTDPRGRAWELPADGTWSTDAVFTIGASSLEAAAVFAVGQPVVVPVVADVPAVPPDVGAVKWERPYARQEITSRVVIGREGDDAAEHVQIEDPDGGRWFGWETIERTGLLTESTTVMGTIGGRILAERGLQSAPRIRSVTLNAGRRLRPGIQDATIDLMFGLDVWKPSRYRIRHRLPTPRGVVFDLEMFATGVRHTITPGSWTAEVNMDPAAPHLAYPDGRWDVHRWDRSMWR